MEQKLFYTATNFQYLLTNKVIKIERLADNLKNC